MSSENISIGLGYMNAKILSGEITEEKEELIWELVKKELFTPIPKIKAPFMESDFGKLVVSKNKENSPTYKLIGLVEQPDAGIVLYIIKNDETGVIETAGIDKLEYTGITVHNSTISVILISEENTDKNVELIKGSINKNMFRAVPQITPPLDNTGLRKSVIARGQSTPYHLIGIASFEGKISGYIVKNDITGEIDLCGIDEVGIG